jgi:threonine/homoserine efflux transporter RhtA
VLGTAAMFVIVPDPFVEWTAGLTGAAILIVLWKPWEAAAAAAPRAK